jgi:hypothetical protein
MKKILFTLACVTLFSFTTDFGHDQAPSFNVVMTLGGEMHDHDTFGSNERKNWSFNKTYLLSPGGPVIMDQHEECLDEEVAMRIDIIVSMDNRRYVKVHNTIHLYEGDACFQELEARKVCITPEIGPQDPDNSHCTFKLHDDQGDWISFHQTIKNQAQRIVGVTSEKSDSIQ